MRPPRPGSRWSARRLRRRAAYATYIASTDWYTRRALWYSDHLQITGTEPACAVCAQPWRLHTDDLHHASYHRLGHEHHTDLIPLCRAHHQALHHLCDTNPAWRKLGRAHATAGIIAALQRHHHPPGSVSVQEHTT